MKPLGMFGLQSEDFDFFNADQKKYKYCEERGQKLYDEKFLEFMGPSYSKPPKPNLQELKASYENRLQRYKRFQELNAPQIIIDNEGSRAVELEKQIRQKEYGSSSDPSYIKYRKAYEQKVDKWNDSEEKEQILDEIYEYNFAQYQEAVEKKQNTKNT